MGSSTDASEISFEVSKKSILTAFLFLAMLSPSEGFPLPANDNPVLPRVSTSQQPYFDEGRNAWYTELMCSYESTFAEQRCRTATVQWSTLSSHGEESPHGGSHGLLKPKRPCTSRLEIAITHNTSKYFYLCETTGDTGHGIRSFPPYSPNTNLPLRADNSTIVVALGDNVTATCPSNYPRANATVWNRRDEGNVNYYQTHLHIERFSTRNAGEYECRAVGDPSRNILTAPTNSFLNILQMERPVVGKRCKIAPDYDACNYVSVTCDVSSHQITAPVQFIKVKCTGAAGVVREVVTESRASITVNVHLEKAGDAAGECKVWYENRAGDSDTKGVTMKFEPCYDVPKTTTEPTQPPTSKNHKSIIPAWVGGASAFAFVFTVILVAIKLCIRGREHQGREQQCRDDELHRKLDSQGRDILQIKSLQLESLDSDNQNRQNRACSARGKESLETDDKPPPPCERAVESVV